MFDAIFIAALVLFVTAVVLNIGRLVQPLGQVRSTGKVIYFLWIIMLIGMTLWTPHSVGVQDFGFFSSTYTLQIVTVVVITVFAFAIIAQSALPVGTWRNGVTAMLAYGVYAMSTAIVSPIPLLTLWKAGLVVLDVLLVVITIAHLGEKGRELLFNLVISFLQVLVIMVIASAIIWPDEALRPVGGLVGVHLFGVVPYLNPNEIGFVCAITALVALRRIPDSTGLKTKYLYFAMMVSSLIVLILSQARTSVIAFMLGMIFLGIVIRKLRMLVVIGSLLFVAGVGYSVVTGSSLGVGEVATTYMERGLSQEKLESMSGRTHLWQLGFELFERSPIIGHGFEAGVRFGEIGSHMHNAHMQALVNTGVIGYLLWLTFVCAVGIQLLSVRKKCALKNATSAGRLHYEIMAVYGVMILRTITGSVLVFHQYSLVILMAIQVYLFAVWREHRIGKQGSGTGVTEPRAYKPPARILKKTALKIQPV